MSLVIFPKRFVREMKGFPLKIKQIDWWNIKTLSNIEYYWMLLNKL